VIRNFDGWTREVYRRQVELVQKYLWDVGAVKAEALAIGWKSNDMYLNPAS
jgi:hypothetical protein